MTGPRDFFSGLWWKCDRLEFVAVIAGVASAVAILLYYGLW